MAGERLSLGRVEKAVRGQAMTANRTRDNPTGRDDRGACGNVGYGQGYTGT